MGLTVENGSLVVKLLSRVIEDVAKDHGMHVALTGGQLYKSGPRKDIDFVLYSVRQINVESIDWMEFWEKLYEQTEIQLVNDYGFCKKAIFPYEGDDINIDFLFPEAPRNEDSDEY